MKIINYFQVLILASLLIISCSKSVDVQEIECEFTEELCTIVPFCAWPPSPNATLALPVAFQYNDAFVSHEEYSFLWSSNPDFGAGAISIRYDDLPVTVLVTELATGCEVEVVLKLN